MRFIKINLNEKLNVAAVKLYHVSTRELAEQKSETVLKITTMGDRSCRDAVSFNILARARALWPANIDW
jgi:hypothetical protein